MKPIDITGPNALSSRAPAAGRTPVAASDPVRRLRGEAAQADGPSLSLAAAGSAAPVDAERVATIRKAIEDGSYPIIPMQVADAMIAAGLLLRTK
jgi:negative regulator of flagellin synthesis FlgM